MTGAGCNTVMLGGSVVTLTSSTGTPPTPAGGTIVTGTYSLTSSTQYVTSPCASNPAGLTAQSTIVVSASAMTVQIYSVESYQGNTEETHLNDTFMVSESDLTTTPTCGIDVDAGAGAPSPYTATSTSISVFGVDNQGLDAGECSTTVQVYTLP
jgi:hypothetical protein